MIKTCTYDIDFDSFSKVLDLQGVGPEQAAAITGKTSRTFYNRGKNWANITVKEFLGFCNATGMDPCKLVIRHPSPKKKVPS